MKKRAKKDKFSTSEVGALIESLRAEIKPILEAIPEFRTKLDDTFEQVGKNTEKLTLVEVVLKALKEQVDKNADKIEVNRQLINQVLEDLKSKVDHKDFETLKKKVASFIT